MNRVSKGQFTVIALLATTMTFLAFARIYPVIDIGIQNATAVNGSDAETDALIRLIPFFIVLAIALTAIFTVLPVKET